ncbi:oligosaccharide repeat unit polymerase [bacterium]|nr:oligosaccharide repeat unit polymerase [bacterium]
MIKSIKQFDLSRPDFLFCVIWLIATALAFVDLYEIGIENSIGVSSLIGFNILSFFLAYFLVRKFFGNKSSSVAVSLSNENLHKLKKLTYALSGLWFALFLFIIYKSNGLPVFWSLFHIKKSYVDYGVPTVSGFANSIRVFIFCLSIYLYLKSKDKKILIVAILMFLFSLTELARGNTVYLVICGLAVFLLNVRFNLLSKRLALFLALCFTIFTVFFGFVEKIRTPEVSDEEKKVRYQPLIKKVPDLKLATHSLDEFKTQLYGVNKVYVSLAEQEQQILKDRFVLYEQTNLLKVKGYTASDVSRYANNAMVSILVNYELLRKFYSDSNVNLLVDKLDFVKPESFTNKVLQKMPHGFKTIYLYITTPVSNLYFAESQGIYPLYYPYYSLQVVVPTVVRNKLFANQQYPIKLRSKTYNATSFYSPFISDFGFVITAIIVFLIQLVVSFVHLRAQQGLWSFQLIYAPLFTSVALSFFYTYIISPSVLIFPAFVCFFGTIIGIFKLKDLLK